MWDCIAGIAARGRPWGHATLASYRRGSLSEEGLALSYPIRATKWKHTLLHVATMPRLWSDWLTEAGYSGLQPLGKRGHQPSRREIVADQRGRPHRDAQAIDRSLNREVEVIERQRRRRAVGRSFIAGPSTTLPWL